MRLFMNCLTSKSLYILTDSQTDKTEITTEKGADSRFYANKGFKVFDGKKWKKIWIFILPK